MCFSVQIVHVELEAAELQISTLKAQSDTSREEVDSGRAAKLQVLLEKSQANVASAEQKVKRLEQQLAGSPADAALHQTELKKLNKARSEVQAACINLLLPYCACLPLHHPPPVHLLLPSCTPSCLWP